MSFEELVKKIKDSFKEKDDIETTDPNLQQGKQFLSFQENEKTGLCKHLKLLECTNSNKFKSIKETLENMDSTKSPVNVDNHKLLSLTQIEDLFNKTLSEYNTSYKSFIHEMMSKQNHGKNEKYYGKIVKTKEDNHYYINKYGYSQSYSTSAWGKKDSKSCPVDNVEEDIDISLFPKGSPMGIGQPCQIAGHEYSK